MITSGGGVKFQYIAAISVNIVSASYGLFCGSLSSSGLELAADDSPLPTGPLSQDELGWIGGMMCVGGVFGTIFFAWYAEQFGLKRSLLLVALPSLLTWLFVPFAQNSLHLHASRFFGGAAGGACFAIIPLYVAELAEDSVRGVLGTFIVLSLTIGVLLGFVLGYFFNYIVVAWISAPLPILYFICFAFLPETPQELLKRDKREEAEEALRYYRNIRSRPSKELSEEFQYELQKLRTVEKSAKEAPDNDQAASWRDLCHGRVGKAFLIGMGLIFLNNFSGCFVMLNYTASIFKQAGSNLSPNLAAIIVGVIQFVGTYMSTLLVERAGRKSLMMISAIGTGLGLAAMGGYSFLDELGYDVRDFTWVPVASFSFLILLSCLGILSLPFLIIAELIPSRLLNLANMILMTVLWILSIFLMMGLPILIKTFKMHGTMFFFSSCCFAGTLFMAVFLPETKGKSNEAILASL